MQKIGDIIEMMPVTHRTLRFWEEAGLIQSVRLENGYRCYDEENVRKIKQTVILRQLDLPIRDIEAIYKSGNLTYALDVLKQHADSIRKKAHEYDELGLVIDYIAELIEKAGTLDSMFLNVDTKTDVSDIVALNKQPSSPRKEESMKEEAISRNEIRIVKLPPFHVADSMSDSDTPEDDSWHDVEKLINQHKLDRMPGFRMFGYGLNRPSDGRYVYHQMVAIPEDMKVEAPCKKLYFEGGLYASLSATLADIGERWNQLHKLVIESGEYMPDNTPTRKLECLEEILDLDTFFNESTPISLRQLDLLLPIKKLTAEEKLESEKEIPIRIEIVDFPETRLFGSEFAYSPSVNLAKLHVPWYRLAQNMYTMGATMKDFFVDGQNTFLIIYNDLTKGSPFTDATKTLRTEKIFTAVQASNKTTKLPESLSYRILGTSRCLKVSSEAKPDIASAKKLNIAKIYETAIKYLYSEHLCFDSSMEMQRDFRFDGRTVNKIELYFFLKS